MSNEIIGKKLKLPIITLKIIKGKRYREIIADLQIWRIQEYAKKFPKSKMISKALGEEVF